MEKNIYRSILISFIFISACKTNSKIDDRKPVSSLAALPICTKESTCAQKLECFYQIFYKDGIRIDPSISDGNEVFYCAGLEAGTGNKLAQKSLFDYFTRIYTVLINQGRMPSEIAESFYSSSVTAFGCLRGKEAFELALMYAADTKEIIQDDTNIGGNTGLNVITYIINPMIKSVGGYDNLSEYLRIDKKKNRSCKWIVSRPNEIGDYEFYYCEIKKAYAEGKIILKEYGE